jgi:hypothetical protein
MLLHVIHLGERYFEVAATILENMCTSSLQVACVIYETLFYKYVERPETFTVVSKHVYEIKIK